MRRTGYRSPGGRASVRCASAEGIRTAYALYRHRTSRRAIETARAVAVFPAEPVAVRDSRRRRCRVPIRASHRAMRSGRMGRRPGRRQPGGCGRAGLDGRSEPTGRVARPAGGPDRRAADVGRGGTVGTSCVRVPVTDIRPGSATTAAGPRARQSPCAEDGGGTDLGYVRLVVRPHGKVVAVTTTMTLPAPRLYRGGHPRSRQALRRAGVSGEPGRPASRAGRGSRRRAHGPGPRP